MLYLVNTVVSHPLMLCAVFFLPDLVRSIDAKQSYGVYYNPSSTNYAACSFALACVPATHHMQSSLCHTSLIMCHNFRLAECYIVCAIETALFFKENSYVNCRCHFLCMFGWIEMWEFDLWIPLILLNVSYVVLAPYSIYI